MTKSTNKTQTNAKSSKERNEAIRYSEYGKLERHDVTDDKIIEGFVMKKMYQKMVPIDKQKFTDPQIITHYNEADPNKKYELSCRNIKMKAGTKGLLIVAYLSEVLPAEAMRQDYKTVKNLLIKVESSLRKALTELEKARRSGGLNKEQDSKLTERCNILLDMLNQV